MEFFFTDPYRCQSRSRHQGRSNKFVCAYCPHLASYSIMRLQPLKGYNAFSATFRKGKKFSNSRLLAIIVFREERELIEEQQIVHFGVTAKKRTRPAALRNRIKRLLRESLRHIMRNYQPHEGTLPVREIILIWNAIPQKPSLLRFHEVLEAVSDIMARAEQFRQSREKEL